MSATTLILLLLFLAFPISMFVMHRGGGHSHGAQDDSQRHATGAEADPPPGEARQGHGGCGHGGCGHAGHGGGSRHEHTKSGTPA